MKKVILLVLMSFLAFTPVLLKAQDRNRVALDFADTYVLKIKLKRSVVNGKCPCLKNSRCSLFEMSVLQILYCPSNSVFDSLELAHLRYIAIKSCFLKELEQDNIVTISARPSGSNYYLFFTKHLPSVEGQIFYHPYAYLTSLSPCGKKDFFEKYILKQMVK